MTLQQITHTGEGLYEVQSQSSEATYRVQVANGQGVCNCPGYETHGHCWHITAALNAEAGSTSTALVPIKVQPPARTLPTRDELTVIGTLARSVVGARGHAVPASIDSPAKAAAIMLAGWELGVLPMVSLRHIYVVNGRTEPDAQLLMGIVLSADPTARFTFEERTTDRCCVRLSRAGRPTIRSEYTIADAKRSGQLDRRAASGAPGPWQLYPRDMLAWAAVKRACRLGAPELINRVAGLSAMGAVAEALSAAAWEEQDANPRQEETATTAAAPPKAEALPTTGSAELGWDWLEVSEAEQEAEQQTEHPAPAVDDDLRLRVDELRATAERVAAEHPQNATMPPSEKQLGWIKDAIDKVVDKAGRELLVGTVFDRSVEQLTRAQASALIGWLQSERFSTEAQRLVAHASGQQELIL